MKDPNILSDSAIQIGGSLLRVTIMKNEEGKPVLFVAVKARKGSRRVANRVRGKGFDLLLLAVVEP